MEGQHSTWSSQEGVGRGEVEMNILVAAVPAECARGDQARDPRELADRRRRHVRDRDQLCASPPAKGQYSSCLIGLRRNVVFQAHPSGSDRDEYCVARGQVLAVAHWFDPQQRQTEPVPARPHFTDLASICGHDRSR